MRVSIYCRYSSDRQRETSIVDQQRVCQDYSDREGWDVVSRYSDEGVSGSTPVGNRRGGAALLADAMAGRFDVLLIEGLDRLSRDSVQQETILRRLEHRRRIRVVGVADGYDSDAPGKKLHRGMRGMINESFLDDLRKKTHRGQTGQFSRGYSAGGGGYGYRSVHDGYGYKIEIDEVAAGWVRWIYERYAAGVSPRKIVHELNRLGVPSPRGKTWAVSAIYGSPAKGTGILNNPLYFGQYIWNRSEWVKHPDTGTRQRFDRPKEEWLIEDRQDLRIIPQSLELQVRQRFDEPRADGKKQTRGRPGRTLFGGLLICGLCGGAVVAVNARLYGCATRHDRGDSVCRGIYAPRDHTDTRLTAWIRDDLLSPEAIAELGLAAAAILRSLDSVENNRANNTEQRLVELGQEIDNLVNAIVKLGVSQALQKRLAAAEEERDRLASAVVPTVVARPTLQQVLQRYKEKVINLSEALKSDVEQARTALRQMLGSIRVVENEEGVWAELTTAPAVMLKAAGVVYKSGSGGRI